MNYLRNNTFGIEIEFTHLLLKTTAKELRKLNLRNKVRYLEGYRKSGGGFWDVKTDASVSNCVEYGEKFYFEGGEIASPKLTPSKKTFNEIEKVFQSIISAGAKFNKDCGLHIHVDITGVDKFKLLMTILKYENDLYKDFAKSRKRSSYLKPLKPLTLNQINKKIHIKLGEMIKDKTIQPINISDHHSAFYFYERRGLPMIEIRMGQSTADVEKSLNWIKLVLSKIKEARDMDILESMYNDN